MIYYISDLHFGHKNIIRFDNRPFTTVEDMDRAIINNWNNRVTNNDIVYILGDISWYNDEKTYELISQLNGHKRLIKGNHDNVRGKVKNCFELIKDYDEIKDSGKDVVLCHYPITFFNKHHYGAVMLYGHVHNSHEWNFVENIKYQLQELDIKREMYNVGCMLWDYTPRTLEEITNNKK